MVALILDPWLEKQVRAERKNTGADFYDEVWEGVYVMAPAPNLEHQGLVSQLTAILVTVIDWAGIGEAFGGVNVSDREDGWEHNYRCPDVAVVLKNGKAKRCTNHLVGGPDFAVEITSPYDKTRDKLPFYAQVGTRELLLLDRDPWQLELYRLEGGQLVPVGLSKPDGGAVLTSSVVPLTFRLVAGEGRPRIEVKRRDGAKQWTV